MKRFINLTIEELSNIIKESDNLSEVYRKVGYKKTSNQNTLKKLILKHNIDITHFYSNKNKGSFKEIPLSEILVENSTYLWNTSLKKRLVESKLLIDECAFCKNTGVWNGQPLVLQLDHINGNRVDNRLENLRLLCPNCHTQTETYSNKSRVEKIKVPKKIYKCSECGVSVFNKDTICIECYKKTLPTYTKPSRDILKNLIRTRSFLSVGKEFDVSDNAIRKWCKSYDLPFRSSEIKNYSNSEWGDV